MRPFLLIFIVFQTYIAHAYAGENTPAPQPVPAITADFTAGRMKHTTTERIDKVIDAQTILLKNNKIVRLSGIAYPMERENSSADTLFAAKERLDQLLPEGTEVKLWQSFNARTGRINRMGHLLAHLENKKTGEWINGVVVREGLAWAVTDAGTPEMVQDLYALESKARQEKRSVWKDGSGSGLYSADDAFEANGRFAVVEGKVARVSSAQNNIYMNFGADTRKDFTVRISTPLRKSLNKKGINPLTLGGQRVRVRGWIREWNGPFLELETAEHLEIVFPEPSTELSPPISTEPESEPSAEIPRNTPLN